MDTAGAPLTEVSTSKELQAKSEAPIRNHKIYKNMLRSGGIRKRFLLIREEDFHRRMKQR